MILMQSVGRKDFKISLSDFLKRQDAPETKEYTRLSKELGHEFMWDEFKKKTITEELRMKLGDIKLEVEAIISRTEITGVKCPFCSVNDKIKEALEAESTEDELKKGFQEITKVIGKSFEEITEANEAVSKAVDKLKLSLAEKGCFNLDFYQDENDLIIIQQYDILLEGVLYTHNRDINGEYHCMVKESITDFEV